MAEQQKASGNWPVEFFIAAKDLLSERLITACLVLSVVAVLAPILLLGSVKIGFVDRLRQEFIQDPSFREIRPATADLRTPDFFTEIGKWPHIRYMMPSVMMTTREVDFEIKKDAQPVRGQARLLPSDSSDPLYEKLEGKPPAGDSIVITTDIAEEHKIGIGSVMTLSASRIENDKRKRVTLPMTVVGLLPREMLPISTILAAPEIDRQIEAYRAGVAVPQRGWKGLEGDPKRSYDGVVIATPEPLGETLSTTLAIRIGATTIGEADVSAVAKMSGLTLPALAPADTASYVVLTKGSKVYGGRDVEEANAVLRNSRAKAYGVNHELKARLLGKDVVLRGYESGLLVLSGVADSDKIKSLGTTYGLNDRILLPRALEAEWKAAGSPPRVELALPANQGWATGELVVSSQVAGFVDADDPLINAHFLAMIKRGKDIPLAYDATTINLVEQAAGFRGFRVIGDTIDNIPTLVERFNAAGVEVRARSDEILKLQRLNRSLNILVLVVSAVALLGGYSILSSSFFANVQRKHVDYATLRLLGMPKAQIFRIPMAQSFIVAVLGFAVSVACYFVISEILNRFIARELNFDGQLSKLYPSHFLFVGLFVVVGCCLASLMASREATRIDPAQALRAG